MSIFVVIPTRDQENLAKRIGELGDHSSHKLPKGEWIVSYDGTSIELSSRLGLNKTDGNAAVVFAVNAYYGNAPTSIWEWLKARWN